MSNYLNKDDRNFYIYKMYDENDELLYIGKTTNIEARINQHFSKDTIKNQQWKEEVNKKYINVKLENGNFKNTECLFIKLKSYEEWKKHHNEK